MAVNILLADDHRMVREGLRREVHRPPRQGRDHHLSGFHRGD